MRFINSHFADTGDPDRWLSFDDLLLLPQKSTIVSRNDRRLNTQARLTPRYNVGSPIISANMDTITEARMASAMKSNNAFGILHRFYKDKARYLDDIRKVATLGGPVGISVGINTDPKIIEEILPIAKQLVVTIDTAHAHSIYALEQVLRIRKAFGTIIDIIAGNVSTPEAVVELVQASADCIKVGQGSGSLCSTRIVNGCGLPQASAIMLARRALNSIQSNSTLCSDGGIRSSGDIVKALALGADVVMCGQIFAGTEEAPGEWYGESPERFKKYRGQSSRDFLEDIGRDGEVAPEGVHKMVADKGSVIPILKDLQGGLRSGMSYNGVYNLTDLYKKATFILIGENSRIESLPHGMLNA